MAKRVLWAAVNQYIADNPEKAQNKSDMAKIMNVDRRELYAVFSGGRRVSDNMLKVMADFFGLDFEEVKSEHYDRIEKYYEGTK